MKNVAALLLLAVVAPSAALNPITRVVQLLEGLSKKLTFEAKKEEDLFDKYGCWATTIITEKTASNGLAGDRIDSLEAYISDIESGRVEFTSETADLQKQIQELHSGIEQAEGLRKQENEDFKAAKDEMEAAIAALKEAVEILGKVNKEGLLSTKFDLRRVLTIGRNVLDKSDLEYLQRVLDENEGFPKSKAPMKYSPASKKIHKLLEDMLSTFEDNLKDAEEKEEKSEKSHDDLMESKNKELETAQTALTDGNGEGGARDVAKNEAKQEVDDLKKQVEDDEGYVKDTKKAFDEKKKEFKERKKLRYGEIAAIGEAIGVLTADDARDIAKKSLGFLQVRKSRKVMSRFGRAVWKKSKVAAASAVREAGLAARDPRLSLLALQVLSLKAKAGELDDVLKDIDDMISQLEDDTKDDEKEKEECETDRGDKTTEAREVSMEIDDASDKIKSEEEKVKEREEEIKTAEEEIKKYKEELKEAKRQREDENAAYEQAKLEDEQAVELIGNAKDVLKKFYEENFSLLFRSAQKSNEPGEAPPPPPDTFDGGYGGAKKEANGIQDILQTMADDLEKDIKANTKDEKDAVKAYDKMKEDVEGSIEDEKTTIADAEGVIADAKTEIGAQKDIKKEKSESLEATVKELKDMKDRCDFICVNFDMRKKNRKIETEGLKKAKEILEKANK